MRAINTLGLLCLVALPGLAGAQQRGGEPAEIDPNAPADPRGPVEAAEPADDGQPGMGLSISGVTEQEGALSVRGADAMKAGEGALAVFGGRLTLGSPGRRVVLHNHVHVGDGGRAIVSPGGGVVVDGDLTITNASRLIVEDSSFNVNGGSVVLSERGIGRLGRGGSAVFSGESALVVDGGSTLQVSGGNLQFGDTSQFILENDSALTINGGSLTTSGNASFRIASGPIRIIGAIDHDSVPPIYYVNSNVTVSGGSFTVGDRSTVNFENTDLVLRNASVDTNFALLLQGGSCSMRGVDLNVNDGGHIVISEDTAFEARNSRLNVAGGNFEMADVARLDAACAGDVKIASANGKGTATCIRNAINDDEAGQCAGAFFDDTSRRWKCEDTCLKSEKGGMLCGKTGHL
jgi:hypothetical protein